jgi:hypothetical protein
MVKYGSRADYFAAASSEAGLEHGSPNAGHLDVKRATILMKAADALGHDQGSPPYHGQNLPAAAHNVRRATVLMKAAEVWTGHSLPSTLPEAELVTSVAPAVRKPATVRRDWVGPPDPVTTQGLVCAVPPQRSLAALGIAVASLFSGDAVPILGQDYGPRGHHPAVGISSPLPCSEYCGTRERASDSNSLTHTHTHPRRPRLRVAVCMPKAAESTAAVAVARCILACPGQVQKNVA